MRTAILFLFLLFFSMSTRAQFNYVRKFPNATQSSKSNVKILDLGNNHLLFVMAESFLYVSHSYDNGETWGPKIRVGSRDRINHVDAILLPNGRIVILFTAKFHTTETIYSDDDGFNWSYPRGVGNSSQNTKFYYSDKLYIFENIGQDLYYWTSEDGNYWSSYSIIQDIASFSINAFSFVDFSPGNYVLALAGRNNNDYFIKLKKSDALDGSWTDLGTLYQSSYAISNMDGIRDSSGKLWFAFSADKRLYGQSNKNVYFITSEDDGDNWSEPVLFAKSYQDDWNVNLSLSGSNPFAVFTTNRDNGKTFPYYGKLGVSQDEYYPPFIQDYSSRLVCDYPNGVTISATARVFSDNTPVTVMLIYNGFPLETMYDDGQHNDGVAGDSIYGASHSFDISEIYKDSTLAGIWTCDAHASSYSLKLFSLTMPPNNRWDSYCLMNGNVRFAVKSDGKIADFYPFDGYTSYDAIPVIYSAGFMMSGITNGEIWSNAMATSERVEDYVSGTIGDTSTAVYVVKSSDPPFGESWQNWKNAVARGAYFYDGNGDSVYNPVDLNGNGQWDTNEDCPDILGDETVWMVYNDGVPPEDRNLPDVSPQGIEIRQTVWTKYGDDLNKNVFYIRYSIVNRGTVADTLKDVYFGFWADNDVGNYVDDLVGCSIPTRSGFTYNYGSDSRFKKSAPVVMTTLLQGPYRYTGNPEDEATNNMGELLGIKHINGAVNDTLTSFKAFLCSHPTGPPPLTKEHVRNFLLGLNYNGNLVDPCNWPYGEIFGEDCSMFDGHFIYSGNPYDSTGWINTFPTDQLQILNTGPFDLIIDQPVDIIAAYHFAEGETSLQSVDIGLEKAAELQNNFHLVGVEERGTNDLVNVFKLEQNYPNPFNPTTTINYVIARRSIATTKQSVGNSTNANSSTVRLGRSFTHDCVGVRNDATVHVSLKVYDILGREVATLVNKKQAPGKYSVQFNARYLPSGVYFYTLQAGDFIQTKKMVLLK